MANFKYDANAIINANLALLETESRSVDERRLTQLRERALLISRADALLDSDNRTDEYSAFFERIPTEDTIPETEEYLASRNNAQIFSDKLTVCKYLAAEYRSRGVSITERLLGSTLPRESVRIAYFRNAYADAAFRIFSEVLDNPSVVYSSDFTAVCEEVYYGRADMCMLPLDSSRDAKLISFYRLIDKYELNPVLSCDVTTPDGNVTTRYALLQRSFVIPTKKQLDESGCCFFEFSLVPDERAALCDVLAAAKECGLTLYKVDSIPLTYSDSEFSCDVVLNIGSADGLDAFVLFLTLAVPQYEPLGIYPHIRAEA